MKSENIGSAMRQFIGMGISQIFNQFIDNVDMVKDGP